MENIEQKNVFLNIMTLKMLFELNIDTYDKFLEFYNNITDKSFCFYSKYVSKKKNKNIENNIWLLINKPKNKAEENIIKYFENNIENNLWYQCAIGMDNEKINYFYDNIKECNLSNKDVLDRLEKLKELGIEKMVYNKYTKFSEEYKCMKYGIQEKKIEWTFTDGEKKYIPSFSSNEYRFKTTNAKYIYIYKKEGWLSKNEFIFNSFDFDIDSLPSKEELENPWIDQVKIARLSQKEEAIVNTYNLEKSTEIILKELKQMKQLLNSISLEQVDYENLKTLCSMLKHIEGFEKDKDKLIDLIISKYENVGYLAKEEMQQELVRLKKIKLTKKYGEY